MHGVLRLTDEEAREILPQFVALLQDAVHNGASIGFLRPLSDETAEAYWQEIFREVRLGTRILLAAHSQDGTLAGSVQLALCMKPNGLHRAEVQKLLVSTRCRRQGIAKALMAQMECEARAAGRTLLYLDTEPDKPAAEMYAATGWVCAGEIPDYACTPDGDLHGTLLFYRRI